MISIKKCLHTLTAFTTFCVTGITIAAEPTDTEFEEIDLNAPYIHEQSTDSKSPPLFSTASEIKTSKLKPIPTPHSSSKRSSQRAAGSSRVSIPSSPSLSKRGDDLARSLLSTSKKTSLKSETMGTPSGDDEPLDPPILESSPNIKRQQRRPKSQSLRVKSFPTRKSLQEDSPPVIRTSSGSITQIPRRGGSHLPLKIRRSSNPPEVLRGETEDYSVDSLNQQSLNGLTPPRRRAHTSSRKGLNPTEEFMHASRIYSPWAGSPSSASSQISSRASTPKTWTPKTGTPTTGSSRSSYRRNSQEGKPLRGNDTEHDSFSEEDFRQTQQDLLDGVNEAFQRGEFSEKEVQWTTIIGRDDQDLDEDKKPIKSLEELGVNAEQLQSDRAFREAFFRKLVATGLPLKLQSELLEIIQPCDHVHFILNGFDAFQPSSFFQEFIVTNITELSLRQISSVNSDMVSLIAHRSPFLEFLDLSHCSHMERFKGEFMYLRTLMLNRCMKLRQIIYSQANPGRVARKAEPQSDTGLNLLEIQENPILSKLKVESDTLEKIEMDDTPGITDSNLDKLTATCPQLKSISCEGCPQIKYPFLRRKAALLPQGSLSRENLTYIGENFSDDDEFSLILNRLTYRTAIGLNQVYGLTSITLIGCFITDDVAVALSQSPTMVTLNLSNNYIRTRGAEALFQNRSIINLDLSRNYVKDAGAKTFGKENSIEILNLSHNRISDEGTKGFKDSRTLRDLNLSNNFIENPIGLQNNNSIQNLNLSNNRVTDQGAATLSTGNYHTLNLSNNQIGDLGSTNLSQGLHHVSTLILKGNKVTYNGTWYLSRIDTLTFLDLSYNLIEDLAAETLSRNTTFVVLDLRNNKITSAGAARFQFHSKLKALLLGGNEVEDEGARELAKSKSLALLDLSKSKITSTGANQFMITDTLKILVLTDNDLDDAAPQILSGNKHLQSLYLAGNRRIGRVGIDALLKSKNENLKDIQAVLHGSFDDSQITTLIKG